ncbi:recombinase family protein [Olivibacter sp. XZL3]|uniref:recombinase family protein n=1 Tax=Olivibacter sp. XZL3 TaxID=1735116 RepID=UPI0010669549|nr:recombinase family protein [Olivibacter sp. XZL3]
MKVADIYVRVSTDEQADKGYSQRDQEERLKKYCVENKIIVRNTYYEDHSAKSFDRPVWKKMLAELNKNRNQSDLILFTKWDRFSRNAPDAYNMINTLRKLGVEPQAIEQPLDINIPENKMMLAIYLTAPEIENDRRGLNTFYGLRRAKKEGRWTGRAPTGYINLTAANGKKYIAPNGKQAELMQWAFKEISKGIYSTQQIYRSVAQKGLKCSKNNFFRHIRNPMYCGNIVIPEYKDEKEMMVKGLHVPLITEDLFYEVQDVLEGKKRKINTKILSQELLPLKGFLYCARCARSLCASASKGRNAYYHYYHCSSTCGYRLKAEDVNKEFQAFLKEFQFSPAAAELFKLVIIDAFASDSGQHRGRKTELSRKMADVSNKVLRARELLLLGDIDGEDYKEIKSSCDREIRRLEADLENIGRFKLSSTQLEPIIDRVIHSGAVLESLYTKSGVENKRRLIGSIMAEKFTFDKLKHRTAKMTEVYSLICLINNNLKKNKTGQKVYKTILSRQGWNMGLEPTTS